MNAILQRASLLNDQKTYLAVIGVLLTVIGAGGTIFANEVIKILDDYRNITRESGQRELEKLQQISEINSAVSTMGRDISEVKTDVNTLKERTYEAVAERKALFSNVQSLCESSSYYAEAQGWNKKPCK